MIKDQQENGEVERVDEKFRCQCSEYYTLHKEVVRETAQTIKVHSVYDASIKVSLKNVLLNKSLETGHWLQNFVCDILTRSRFRPMLLYGDIEEGMYYVFTVSIDSSQRSLKNLEG